MNDSDRAGVQAGLWTLGQELAEVGRLLETDDVSSALDRYVARMVATVPGCDHATITVGTPTAAETVAGTSLPLLTYRPDHPPTVPSPVLEVLGYREPRRLEDVRTDHRWPEFAAHLARAGYRSALVLPLAATTEPAAAFALFSTQPHQFGETTYDMVLLFALHAGVVFDNASLYHDSRSLIEQLRTSLRTRSTIGQAQGLLMAHYGNTATEAFDALKTASQHHNTKLRDLAAFLVTSHEQDTFTDGLDKFTFPPQASSQ